MPWYLTNSNVSSKMIISWHTNRTLRLSLLQEASSLLSGSGESDAVPHPSIAAEGLSRWCGLLHPSIPWDSRPWGNKTAQGSMDLLYFFQKRHLQKLVNVFGGLRWVDMYIRERWQVWASFPFLFYLAKGICQRTGQVPSGCVQFLLLPPGEGQVRCPRSLGFHGFTETYRKHRQDKKIQCRWRCPALALEAHRSKHCPFFLT